MGTHGSPHLGELYSRYIFLGFPESTSFFTFFTSKTLSPGSRREGLLPASLAPQDAGLL